MCDNPATVPDEVLATRAKSGCRDCFARLYERYRVSPARYLHESFGTDFDSALDIEAEAWRKAFQHLASYRGERPFRAWLLSITRNLALNQIRRRRRAPCPEQLAKAADPPADPVERREALDECVRLVRALSTELREPFVLRTIFDLELKTVAELLAISETTARGRLFRARKALAEAVREVPR
ncbi:MAG TPA: RNA polymerase sigma factor [Planctomycetota bacterium]|nr:RNA polymerase sigma factor [Planctomycetota bacterium]